MIRIGIIGVESNHTRSVVRHIKERQDVTVTAILGETPELTADALEKYGLDCGVACVEEMIGKVDGVMVMLRDGALHLEAVRPLLGHGIAIWADKPFTASVEDAQELLDLLAKHQTPFSGGSHIKMTGGVQAVKAQFEANRDQCMSGYMSYWTHLDSPYSGPHFYAHHLIESMLEAFGTDVRSVTAKCCGDSLAVIASYGKFPVLMNYGVNTYPVHGGFFGEKNSFVAEIVPDGNDQRQLEEFLEVVRTGVSPYSPEFFLTAVKVSNAIVESMRSGVEVKIS